MAIRQRYVDWPHRDAKKDFVFAQAMVAKALHQTAQLNETVTSDILIKAQKPQCKRLQHCVCSHSYSNLPNNPINVLTLTLFVVGVFFSLSLLLFDRLWRFTCDAWIMSLSIEKVHVLTTLWTLCTLILISINEHIPLTNRKIISHSFTLRFIAYLINCSHLISIFLYIKIHVVFREISWI